MLISELSARSGVSVPLIKFYIAEELLPRGELQSRNRAVYTASHLERLQLIRALVDVGGISLARVRRLVQALDADEPEMMTLAAAQDAVSSDTPAQPPSASALARVRAVLGIEADSTLYDHPSAYVAAAALDAFEAFDSSIDTAPWLAALAAGARSAAAADIDLLPPGGTPTDRARTAALGTAFGDILLTELRRLAQATIAAERYGPGAVRRPTRGPHLSASNEHR